MRKSGIKLAAVLFFGLVVVCVISLVYLSLRNASIEQEHLSFHGLETTTIHQEEFIIGSTGSKYTIVFIFNPDCDLCLFELEDVIKTVESFYDVEVDFISYAKIDILKAVHHTYGINAINHIHLLNINADKLPEEKIGYPYPSVVVYNQAGNLIFDHSGYCPFETIISKIRNNENR